MMNNTINQIEQYYASLIRGIEMLNAGDFTSLYLVSKAGLGKSTIVDQILERIKANFVVFRGDMSEAKLFAFLQDNSDKIIILRDVGRLLRKIGFIEILKAITDPGQKRVVSRLVYADHEGVEDSFEFKGKIILELNSIGNRYKEDLEALLNRGLFIELNFSLEDISNIMKLICKTKEDKIITEYLIKKANLLGSNSFNLRTQRMCINVFKAAVRDKLEWKSQIDLFLNTQIPEGRKLLYRLAGYNPVKRIDFVKYLMRELRVTYSTAQIRINEYIYLGDIFTNGLKKQTLLSLNPFN